MFRNTGAGGFELVAPAQTGLEVSGDGIACAVGDFDNDGLPDVAIAMSDRVLLFRNIGGGRFADVMQAARIVPVKQVAWVSGAIVAAILGVAVSRSVAKPSTQAPSSPVVEVAPVEQKNVPIYGEWKPSPDKRTPM